MKTIIEAATYLPKHAVPRLNPKTLIVDKLQSHIQNTCAAELSESTRRGKKWRHGVTEAMGSLSKVTLGGCRSHPRRPRGGNQRRHVSFRGQNSGSDPNPNRAQGNNLNYVLYSATGAADTISTTY